MFSISFYIFSLFLSYTDFKKFLVPNDLVITMSIMLLTFGFLDSKIYISSIVLPLVVLIFFCAIMLINRNIILGGGDIKYMMLVALFLPLKSFALFLLITGILQSLLLLYMQQIRKKKIAPMVPMMFLAVVIVELLVLADLYPLK
ncbi:prepilin peptidase [Poseidonibacter lekithochrous]|uniref:prepilin peptidase n=1 Tax=Poseidonibacter lekithochrous TaxID=1904463 RepID=UPI0008FCA4B8|nr:prepilin peptidase [Poseidonibacter lekithochrous]QKJ24331.1 prepilin peptidase, putative TadV [Poseidonibacter lekithochrous]